MISLATPNASKYIPVLVWANSNLPGRAQVFRKREAHLRFNVVTNIFIRRPAIFGYSKRH